VVTRPARIDRWFYYPKFAPDGSILSLIEQDRDTWLARIDAATTWLKSRCTSAGTEPWGPGCSRWTAW